MTVSSGLPECLFNSSYSQLEAFSTTISCFYDDKIHWVLASKEKVDELANLNDNGGSIVKQDFYGHSHNAHKSGFFF